MISNKLRTILASIAIFGVSHANISKANTNPNTSRYIAVQLIEYRDIVCQNYSNCGWTMRVATVGGQNIEEPIYSSRVNWGDELSVNEFRNLVNRHRKEREPQGRRYITKDWYCAKIVATVFPKRGRRESGYKKINLYKSPSSTQPNLFQNPSACYCIKSRKTSIPRIQTPNYNIKKY